MPHSEETKERLSAIKRGKPAPWKHRNKQEVDGATLYQCGTCRLFFGVSEFYANRRTLLGIKSQCKRCHKNSTVKSRDRENNRRIRRESEARRRARKAGAAGHVSAEDMFILTHLWGDRCLKCAATKYLQWDHVQPIAKGGAHCVSNLQRLCRVCNEKKQATYADYRTPEQKVWAITFKRVQP